MNRKTLILLVAAAALALLAAIVLHVSQKPRSEGGVAAASDTPLAPALRDHLNDVDRVVVTGADGKALVTLARGDRGWTVAEKGGYAADTGKLRALLLRIADADLRERKTANPDKYAQLGVEDVAGKDAKGVQLDIGGLAAPLQLVVGNANPRGGGSFVRRAGEADSWLVSESIDIERDPVNWLVRDLVDVDAARIAEVTLVPHEGKPVRATRKAQGDANLVLADVPKGREVASEYAVNSLASTLADLRLDDVQPAADADAEPPADARKAAYRTFDGLVVELVAWSKDDRHHARLVASFDEEAANRHVDAAQKQAKAGYEEAKAAAPAADAADGAVAAADVPQPLAVSDPARDREQRIASTRAEVEALQRRLDGWTFVIPAHKWANIDKSIDDLLKPVEDAKASAKKKR